MDFEVLPGFAEMGQAMVADLQQTLQDRGVTLEGVAPGMPTLTGVFALMKTCRQYADEAAEGLSLLAGVRLADLDCRAGCSHCCHMLVTVTPPELLLVLDAFNDVTDPQALRARVLATARQVAAITDPAERLGSGIICPLLGNDGRCLVYAARPIACRTYFSRSEAECVRSITSPNSADTAHSLPAQFGRAVASATMLQLLHQAGLDGTPIELVQGLAFILRQPAEHMLAWASGKPMYSV